MAEYIKQASIDDVGGQVYQRVDADIQAALNRRFEKRAPAVYHPDKEGVILYDIENFWDGPSEVKDLGNGDLEYRNPYNGDADRFRREGYYNRAGELVAWSQD